MIIFLTRLENIWMADIVFLTNLHITHCISRVGIQIFAER